MKVLVPVDGSRAALAPIEHLVSLKRSNVPLEVLVINVQPRFHRHISRFSTSTDRDALRAERSGAAMAGAIDALSSAGIAFRTVSEVGQPAERIAEVAQREGVDEVMIGTGRHPAWLRAVNPSIAQGVMARIDIPVSVFARGKAGLFEKYAVPAGVASAAALILVSE